MRSRLLTAFALASVFLAVGAGPVFAEGRPPDPPGPGGTAYVDPEGNPTAGATDGGASTGGGGGGGGGSGESQCHWEVSIEDDLLYPIYDVDTLTTQHSQTGRWLQYWCDGIGVVDVDGFFATPEGGLVDPEALALEALESIGIEGPSIRTSPSADGRLYVRIPTWMWIEQGWWQTYQATAAAGRVTSTVTARPVSTSWSMGDGNSVRCTGPGTPWRPGLADDATDCRHTYRHSSAGASGERYSLQATVTLQVTWTSNVTDGGTLPAITRTSSVDVRVGEIQAIGTD